MDRHSPVPIVRLTLESMQKSILHAFQDQILQIDEQVREAVLKVCTPEHVQKLLDEETAKAIDSAVESEVRSFFAYGEGRRVVKKAVERALEQQIRRMDDEAKP